MRDRLVYECWQKDMYLLFLHEESIPGVDFSIWRSREGDLEMGEMANFEGL